MSTSIFILIVLINLNQSYFLDNSLEITRDNFEEFNTIIRHK